MDSDSMHSGFRPESGDSGNGEGSEVVTADDVRWLLRNLDMHEHLPLLSMQQVTPSLIVKLFRKLFTVELHDFRPDDDSHNMHRLLEALAEGGLRLDVSATEIANGNPEHMNQLLQLCVDAHQQQREMEERRPVQPVDAVPSVASTPVDKFDFIHDYIRRHRSAVSDGAALVPEGSDASPMAGGAHRRQSSEVRMRSREGHRPSSTERVSDGVGDRRSDRRDVRELHGRVRAAKRTVSGAHCEECETSEPLGQSSQPSFAGLRGETAKRTQRVMEQNRRRDERIERLRASRFINSVRDLNLSRRLADHCSLDAERRRRVEGRATRERKDALELRRMVREDDERQRTHLMNRIHSLANARSGRIAVQCNTVLDRVISRDVQPLRDASAAGSRSFTREVRSWRLQNPLVQRVSRSATSNRRASSSTR